MLETAFIKHKTVAIGFGVLCDKQKFHVTAIHTP